VEEFTKRIEFWGNSGKRNLQSQFACGFAINGIRGINKNKITRKSHSQLSPNSLPYIGLIWNNGKNLILGKIKMFELF